MITKIKSITKAFVVIALLPILVFFGFLTVSPIAEMCFGDISHPLMAFLALLFMLPWGFLFYFVFYFGVGTMRTLFAPFIFAPIPAPTIVIISHGNGGYSATSGKGRGGGMALAIIRFVFMIPFALIIWFIVSIAMLFNKKLEIKINNLFEKYIERVKSWYKFAILFFVIFPLVVFGFNHIENTVYSPQNIEIQAVNYSYSSTDEKVHSPVDNEYHIVDYYELCYTIDTCDSNLSKIAGEWVVKDKTTGGTITYDANNFVPFDWRWENTEKNTPYEFTTSFAVYREDLKTSEIFSKGLENLEISCKINYISFNSNIPVLSDFLFPTIDNEYKNGYEIILKS